LELLSLTERAGSRIYTFTEFYEEQGFMIQRQIENRDGRLFMRAKKRSLR
jgi:hypothetical protein